MNLPDYNPEARCPKLCACGCGELLTGKYARQYIHGHNQRGKNNLAKSRPESINTRTLRMRARLLIDTSACAMSHLGECKGVIDAHHIDKNVQNNSSENVLAVCRSHHRLLDNGVITVDSKRMPDFYVDSSGKRRYRHTMEKQRNERRSRHATAGL
jgi:hypothetical protein